MYSNKIGIKQAAMFRIYKVQTNLDIGVDHRLNIKRKESKLKIKKLFQNDSKISARLMDRILIILE